jgi:hypothetical protein
MTYAPGCTATPQRTSNKYRSDADEQTGSDAPHASIPPAVHAGPLARAGGPAAAPGGADPRRPARQGGPQPRSPQIAEQGSQDALRRRWTDNIEQTRTIQARLAPREPLDPAVICETERLASRFLAGRVPLFDARIREPHTPPRSTPSTRDHAICRVRDFHLAGTDLRPYPCQAMPRQGSRWATTSALDGEGEMT